MASKGKKQSTPNNDPVQSEFVRRFKSNPLIFIGTIIILVIVVIAFVFLPALGGEMGAAAELNFGSYDKIPISYVNGNYLARQQEYYARSMQGSVDDQNYQIAAYQIWRRAFEETVVHTAILQEMKNAGYEAPSKLVDRRVAELPDFQENGRFSAALYRQLDNSTRMALWRDVKEIVAKEKYQDDILNLRIPSNEAPFITAMSGPERSFDMAAFSIYSYPSEEITAYAVSNPDLFKLIHLSKITIGSSEREARQILNTVKEGTMTFEDAARTHSSDAYAEKGGDLGSKMAYELSEEIPEAQDREDILGLARGELSQVIKVPSGWAFFRVEESARPADTEDPLLMDRIRSYVMEFERGRVEDWFFVQAEELIADAEENDFDSAVLLKGLEKKSFGPLPINYGGSGQSSRMEFFTPLSSFDVPELSSATYNENFWTTAFSTPVGRPSKPIVLGSYVAVLYPTEEKPVDETAMDYINSSYPFIIQYFAEQDIRSYFLASDKLEDKFMDTFFKLYFSN
ncbi:SurA N-terminal domain-containing protein [Treponema sp. OttesenSCG-928-L16]|nr:SurA N-terminal domain-containing protein [Treponema sp. OttesenSCG-928-L16]